MRARDRLQKEWMRWQGRCAATLDGMRRAAAAVEAAVVPAGQSARETVRDMLLVCNWTLPALKVAVPLTLGAGGLIFSTALVAQNAATTAIADTVQYANGTPAQGTVLLSWPAFVTASGVSVQKGTTSVTLGANGSLNVSLAPNGGATPIGTFYTAVYHLNDGSVTREYWFVPVSSSAVTLGAVRTTVLPSAVAQQTVSKQYVDQAISRAVLTGAAPADTSPYVMKSGDTMTGPLVLPGDPTTALQAADKNYVDENVTALQAGLGQKVSTVPTATQVVTQPANTELRTNRLNGNLYAQEFVSQQGSDGIANALAAPECTTNCVVKVDPDYPGNDFAPLGKTGSAVVDERGGRIAENYFSSVWPRNPGNDVAHSLTLQSTEAASDLSTNYGVGNLGAVGMRFTQMGLRGGNNLFPSNSTANIPYGKSTYSATDTVATNYTQGQHVMDTHRTTCYGVGDCIFGSQYMTSSGGFRDNADEGAHPFDLQLTEDSIVFTGTCSTGCTTGSQLVTVATSSGAGTQGDGRYLVDRAPSKVLSGNGLVGGSFGNFPAALAFFSGTNFPVSTLFTTAAVANPQVNNIAPGVVNMPIQTSGVIAGFATNTASAPAAAGVACIADPIGGGSSTPENYEMVPYTVSDGTHLQMTFLKPHASGATVAIGGLCGYGVEQTVDSSGGYAQVFPVIGTPNATTMYVASGVTSILGRSVTTGGYLNAFYSITSLVRSGNVVTVTVNNPQVLDLSGLSVTVAGATDASFNGTFTATNNAQSQFSYTQTGPNASSSGGTIGVLTGGYLISPMAEVLDVYDDSTATVSGKLKLAPNTVAWAAGDPVSEPHYFQQRIAADIEFVNQYTPRSLSQQQAGIYYTGNNGPGLRGWVINNASPVTNYFGNGGTHGVPDFAFQTQGVWGTAYDLQAGETAAFRVHCNSKNCNRWNSTYNLFTLDTTAGGSTFDSIQYAPQASTMTWILGGTQYSMSPTAMTVGTLNVTNLNAAHINGSAGGGTTAATSSAQGVVQLGPSATSAVLANVATSGSYLDLSNAPAVPTKTSQLTNDASFVNAAGAASAAPVQTVAGRTGAITLSSADVSGLAPSATTDTTNAANLSSGVLNVARLPVGLVPCTSTVAFSATPTFAVNCQQATIHFAWTGNVTGVSFTGLTAGQRLTLIFQVGGAGGYTVQWPSSVHGGFATSSSAGSAVYAQAGKYFVQEFVVDTDGQTLLNPGAVNQ